MKRESIYKRYQPAVTPKCASNIPAYWFIFNSDKLLINPENELKLPITSNLKEFSILPIKSRYIGTIDGHDCYAVEVAPETNIPDGMIFEDLRSLYDDLDEDIFLLAGRAIQIIYWDKNHQFCGKCGAPTETMAHELAKKCPECGLMAFPRLSPAVITAIIKDGKILMAKHGYRGGMYGLIAGFIEPGETLEEGVKREIMEEVGLKVKNIKYFGSQPWPFPNSLMIGFTAKYESGKIQVDGDEITDAGWFSVNELPRIPSRMSIARELIDWYIENYSS